MTVYEIITERIIQRIEEAKDKGEKFHWIKPWTGGPPFAVSYSGKPYRGVNRLILPPGEYITYKGLMEYLKNQPENHGIFIKKGEHKYPVFFYSTYDKKNEDGTPVLDEYGEVAKGWFLKFYQVFNRESIHGLPSHFPAVKTVKTDTAQTELIEKYVNAYADAENLTVDYVEDGARCFYSPSKHMVRLPLKEGFKSLYSYYGALFHELIHSTSKGCNRHVGSSFGSDAYSREELVAEIGSAMLLNHFMVADDSGEDNEADNNIAYIAGWAKKFKDNKKEIAKAAIQAEHAMEYFLETAETRLNTMTKKSA